MTATYTFDVFSSLDGYGAAGGNSWVTRMRNLPATVVSTTLQGPLDWPNATALAPRRSPPRAHLPTHPPLTSSRKKFGPGPGRCGTSACAAERAGWSAGCAIPSFKICHPDLP
jgi:hypothetical protein